MERSAGRRSADFQYSGKLGWKCRDHVSGRGEVRSRGQGDGHGQSSAFDHFGASRCDRFFNRPESIFKDDFDSDTGTWTYTGGIADGSYQDFWHIDISQSRLSDVGPDGCFAETSIPPIPKSASANVNFPESGIGSELKIIHKLSVDPGGLDLPWDGQWVTIDGDVVEPSSGFLYDDNGGTWPHGYFVGNSGGWVESTFSLGTKYNDGKVHTLTFHSSSYDTNSNCAPLQGWQIDYVELGLSG